MQPSPTLRRQPGNPTARAGERQDIQHLLASEALHCIDCCRKAGSEQQGADLSCCLFPGLQVYDLGVCRLLGVPKILRNHVAHTGNLCQFVAHFCDAEIEVLRSNQNTSFAWRSRPTGAIGKPIRSVARLLELLVFLEQCNDVLEPRVKGIVAAISSAIASAPRSAVFDLAASSSFGQRSLQYHQSRPCRK